MAINRTYGFEGVYAELTFYNAKAIIDYPIRYYLDGTETNYNSIVDGKYVLNYSFPGYASSYLYIYDSEERNTLIKSFTSQVTRNSNIQVINASVSDMTFESPGTYYYELGYVRSGYECVLSYGKLFIQ